MEKLSRTVLLLLALSLLAADGSFARGSNQGRGMTRAEALAVLKGCAARPVTMGCSEDTAGFLIGLYNRGDRRLLKPLLDAGLNSDGALSAMLGSFYAEVLRERPRGFLEALASRPRKDQEELSWLAGATDGSGMPDEALREVRRALRRLSARRSGISKVAGICLTEVNKANAAARNR